MSKPDIFSVRPRGESDEDSRAAIVTELLGMGIASLEKGSTQPDGSTLWYVYLEEGSEWKLK